MNYVYIIIKTISEEKEQLTFIIVKDKIFDKIKS